MEKWLEDWCNKNPEFVLYCPQCNHEHIFNSKEMFEQKFISFQCENNKCNNQITWIDKNDKKRIKESCDV